MSPSFLLEVFSNNFLFPFTSCCVGANFGTHVYKSKLKFALTRCRIAQSSRTSLVKYSLGFTVMYGAVRVTCLSRYACAVHEGTVEICGDM